MLLGGLPGGFLCLTFILIEDKLERLFAKPLRVVLVAIPLIYTAIIAIEHGAIYSAIMGLENFFGESLILETIAFSLAMSMIINFSAMLNRLLGNHVLAGLIFGKYHRPVTERRFVMYLDLAGSTSIAERRCAIHAFVVRRGKPSRQGNENGPPLDRSRVNNSSETKGVALFFFGIVFQELAIIGKVTGKRLPGLEPVRASRAATAAFRAVLDSAHQFQPLVRQPLGGRRAAQ